MIAFLFQLYVIAGEAFRQRRCEHHRYRENMACHGVCVGCNKDLGFIGTLREAGRGREVRR